MLKDLKPTGTIISLDGKPWCRMWEGRTESGKPVTLHVHRVQALSDSPANAELEAMLKEVEVPLQVSSLTADEVLCLCGHSAEMHANEMTSCMLPGCCCNDFKLDVESVERF